MKLRVRLLVTLVALAVPIVLGIAYFSVRTGRQSLVEATYEATLARMESGGRERCEARQDRFLRAALGPRARRRRARGRAEVQAVYSDRFEPLVPAMPPLDPELRAPLEEGDDVAVAWSDRRASIAMRMPWDGPCAVLVVYRLAPSLGTRALGRSLSVSALVAALTALAALLALGPLVRRIRTLTEAVREQATSGYEGDVVVQGSDEVADLARAFNEASSQIRARLGELSARDRTLTEFLGNTTHDVMVPLTVLLGHLSDLASTDDDPRVRAAIEEAHYLASLLRNLSAAARLEAGEPMLARHRVDLREIVERVMSRHRPIARGRGVSLDYAVPEVAVEAQADSTLLEQAIGNLVHNAIRHNEEGGHVAVILEPGFSLTVKDDGPGIPADELARVSERSFRGGEARQRRPGGLGLGLHIVRDVAEKHAYELEFTSPPSGGLTVVLRGTALSDASP